MKNYEYEKEFPWPEEPKGDIDSSEEEIIKALFQNYEDLPSSKTYMIIPYAPLLFNQIVANCELIAKEFCGKLKATIDYSKFKASIKLWLVYVEFERDEFMSILLSISIYALSVHLTPLLTGDLLIEIEMPYFICLTNPDDPD